MHNTRNILYALLIALIIALFIALAYCYAGEIYAIGRIGYSKLQLKKVSSAFMEEAGLGYKWRKIALDLSAGHFRANVKGDEESPTELKHIGALDIIPIILQVKFYPVDWLFVGVGGGQALVGFDSKFNWDVHTNSRVIGVGSAGFEWKGISLEYRYTIGDLKIESGHPTIGILEDRSSLASHQILIGFKKKF